MTEIPDMPPDPSPKRKYTRLSPAVWAEIRACWQSGEPTLAELCERYGVETRTLQAHFEKHGTVKGSAARELAKAVEAEVLAEILPAKDDLAARAREVREAAYRGAVEIEALLTAALASVRADPSTAYKAAATVKMLSLASAALERLHTLKRAALGLDHAPLQDELSELVIRGLTEDEEAQIRDAHGDDLDARDMLDAPPSERPAEQDDEVVILNA